MMAQWGLITQHSKNSVGLIGSDCHRGTGIIGGRPRACLKHTRGWNPTSDDEPSGSSGGVHIPHPEHGVPTGAVAVEQHPPLHLRVPAEDLHTESGAGVVPAPQFN